MSLFFSGSSHSLQRCILALFLIFLAALASVTPIAAEGQKRAPVALLEAGTVLPVRLDSPLSSRESREGDTFTAKLHAEDRKNYSGLPFGTILEGTVRSARRQRGDEPGMLNLDFHRVRFPDGRSYPIQGSLIGLDEKSVTRTNDGRLVAKPAHRNDRSAYVGYGAGIGLIAGLFRKRPLEDTLLGAGLGYLLGATQKTRTEPRDIVLKAGTELGVRLDGRFRYADMEEEAAEAESDLKEPDRGYSEAVRSEETGKDEVQVRGKASDIGVLVDEEDVVFEMNTRPVVSEEKIFLPLVPVLRAAKIRYRLDKDGENITVMGDKETLQITAGSRVALVDGSKRVRMVTAARRLNGALYAPLHFLELVFRQQIDWDAATQTVLITTGTEEPNRAGGDGD